MNWKDLLPGKDLDLVTGVENTLRSRRRAGSLVIVLTALLQVGFLIGNSEYLQKVAGFLGRLIVGPREGLTAGLQLSEVIGIAILLLGISIFALARWSRVLLEETGEPFRYTFWIDGFRPVKSDNAANLKIAGLDLLQYDLRDRLNSRIRRLSLLDETAANLKEGQYQALIAHIHITGEYVVRTERDKDGKVSKLFVRVMPRVRIGPPGQAERPTTPVEIALLTESTSKTDGVETLHLDPLAYQRAVERCYSQIAHEIYKRIKADLGDKVKLFPTAYMRAVALYHEAQDFERSNTIDAYDYALELYREANRYFDTRLFGPASRLLARLPLLWLLVRRSLLMEAETKIGYARCLIYRRAISAISGRYQNPLFIIPRTIKNVIRQLERVNKRLVKRPLRPKDSPSDDPASEVVREVLHENRFKQLLTYLTFASDSPLRRWEKLKARLSHTLFQAYSVGALCYAYLEASQRAKSYLEEARAIAPRLSEQNALWLLAAAECEVSLDSKLQWLERAAEQDPEFEIALYRRAFFTEMRLRSRNEIESKRVESVIDYYKHVLELNPANIGALAATAYLWWLIGDLKNARQRYEEGLEVKAIVSQTFIGDLSYGLARVLAEEGDQPARAFQLFSQALSADPGVGAFSKGSRSQQVSAFFEYISTDMLARFDRYEGAVRGAESNASPQTSTAPGTPVDETVAKTRRAVYGYVLNDCGNAYLNAFLRNGDPHNFDHAVSLFERATRTYPDNCAAYYNLDQAYSWSFKWADRIEDTLEKARELAPSWPALAIASIRSRRNRSQSDIDLAIYDVQRIEKLISENEIELEKTKTEILLAKMQLRSMPSQNVVAPTPRQTTNTPAGKLFETRAREASGVAVASVDPNLPGRLEKKKEHIQQQLESHRKDLKKANEDLEQRRIALREVITQATDEIANQTKLSFIFDFKKIPGAVDVLTGSPVQWDRLDQNDVEALITLADFLSQSSGEVSLLQLSQRMAKYILEGQPENYQAFMCLDHVFKHRLDARLQFLQTQELKRSSRSAGTGDGEGNHDSHAQGPDGMQLEPQLGSGNGNIMASDAELIDLTKSRNHYRNHIERILHDRLATNLNRFNVVHDIVSLLEDDSKIQEFLSKQPDFKENKDTYLVLLARSYVHRFRWDEAIVLYKTVLRESPTNADALSGLALIFSERRQWTQAIRMLRTAILYAPDRKPYLSALAVAYNAAGIEHLEKKRGNKAIESFRLACETDPLKAEYHASLSAAWESAASQQRVTALTLAAASITKARELDASNADYVERERRLHQVLSLSEQYGEEILDMKAEINPVVIKVGKGLFPLIWIGESEEMLWGIWSDLFNYEHLIRVGTGLELPVIQLVRDYQISNYGYSFELWGVPEAHGEVLYGKRLTKNPVTSLEDIGVEGEAPVEWWLSGYSWFDEKDLVKVEQAFLPVGGPLEAMWLHFDTFLRNHMLDLIGYQPVLKMLTQNKSPAAYQLAGSPTTVSALSHVLRMLAMEKVPLTSMQEICDRFAEDYEEGLGPIAIVERIRQLPSIRPQLQGNNRDVLLLPLSEAFEKLIQDSIHREGNSEVLAIDPLLCQEALASIREEVAKGPAFIALLVEKAEIRPHLRRLVELEFPYFWVLSRPEVEDEKDKSLAENRILKNRVLRLPNESVKV
jgi:tetratricopeptide (TPR) repeat protein